MQIIELVVQVLCQLISTLKSLYLELLPQPELIYCDSLLDDSHVHGLRCCRMKNKTLVSLMLMIASWAQRNIQ